MSKTKAGFVKTVGKQFELNTKQFCSNKNTFEITVSQGRVIAV